MFDSLKSRFRNIFKKGQGEAPAEAPKAEPVKEKPVKEKPKKVEDDDWDDDWDENDPNDLIPEDEWTGDDLPDDEAEDAPAAKKKEEPVRDAPRPAAQTAAAETPRAEPVRPVPAKVPEQTLSRKERARLAKQEKIAAKETARREAWDKKHAGEDVVGDHGKKIKEDDLDSLLWELELALMEADVALPVAEEIKNGVKEDLMGKRYARGHTLDDVVETSIKDSILKILRINEFDFDAWFEKREKPAVIMFVGINGTGKTTSIAKIANRMIKNGKTVVLAAADTFRAGAIEQLTIHSERLGCKIVKHSADADPAAVAFDAIEHAKAKRKDAVLVDTAGRMQTNSNLMDEMKKIKKVAKPDLVMFVGDSLAGNDAVEQARAFDAAIGVDAIMLTKIDADSKGGAALSIAHTIGKPIAFVSNGQEYDQLVKFDAKWMMDRLFED